MRMQGHQFQLPEEAIMLCIIDSMSLTQQQLQEKLIWKLRKKCHFEEKDEDFFEHGVVNRKIHPLVFFQVLKAPIGNHYLLWQKGEPEHSNLCKNIFS